MRRNLLLFAVMAVCILPASAKKKDRPPDPAWAGITARGRMLAEYDIAAWHATDAVMALNPPKDSATGYIAKKTDAGWVVAFGRFNDQHDKFLIVYLATQGTSPQEFRAAQNIPFQEDTGFFYMAARAVETCRRTFQGEKRPYNFAVLPADSDQMYVYIYPAQTKTGIYPLGGDVRYLVSPDGASIIESRQLHKTIMEMDPSRILPGVTAQGGWHTHVLSDAPEDTDVFHALRKKPSGPEYIGAGKRIYKIEVDGTISLAE